MQPAKKWRSVEPIDKTPNTAILTGAEGRSRPLEVLFGVVQMKREKK